MRIIKERNVVQFREDDIFYRQLIIFSEKLIDESVNDWFRDYIKELSPNTDMSLKREEICSHLQEHFGFSENDFGVWLLPVKSEGFGGYGKSKAESSYKISNSTGDKSIIFDKYNGFWYTATETGKDEGLILFDYGDWYCMYGIFPLANYFVSVAQEHSNKKVNG